MSATYLWLLTIQTSNPTVTVVDILVLQRPRLTVVSSEGVWLCLLLDGSVCRSARPLRQTGRLLSLLKVLARLALYHHWSCQGNRSNLTEKGRPFVWGKKMLHKFSKKKSERVNVVYSSLNFAGASGSLHVCVFYSLVLVLHLISVQPCWVYVIEP